MCTNIEQQKQLEKHKKKIFRLLLCCSHLLLSVQAKPLSLSLSASFLCLSISWTKLSFVFSLISSFRSIPHFLFFYLMAEVHFFYNLALMFSSVLWPDSKHFVPSCTCSCQLKSKALYGYLYNILNSCSVVPNLMPDPISPSVSGKRPSDPFAFVVLHELHSEVLCGRTCVIKLHKEAIKPFFFETDSGYYR